MDEECKQLLMILMGTAGTDKSYTVHAICKMCLELLHPNQQLHLLAAPTGTAAYQINGRTVHALLGLPTKNVTVMSELAPNRKARLEQQWEHIRLLLIDEQSMVGRRMLGMINRRLKQIKGSDRPFGGVHVILIGDNGNCRR
mmetsp:Transcript_41887/g.107188  ORF Transcript_41887/g.107188 Transcript_41887/m.107188 type:complete len:142 (+) Transcript_41887:1357-1782(+)